MIAGRLLPLLRSLVDGLRRSFTRREAVILVLALAAYVAVHTAYLVPGFGEQDGARLAVDAAEWHESGKIGLDTTDYRMRTSPLYIHGLKRALDFGLPIGALPRFMDWVSLAFSAMGLLAAYLLFRQLGGRTTAALACGLLTLAPAFWLSGIYGMAHGPALDVWLCALLCFSTSMNDETSERRFRVLAIVSGLLAFVALGLKADLVLNGLAFPGLAFVRRRLTWKRGAVGCAIVVIGLGLQILYSKSVVTAGLTRPHSPGQTVAERLESHIPFTWDALSDRVGFGAITHAPGPFLFAVALFALFAHLASRERFRLGLFAAAWGLPIVMFWGLMIGNSARHNISALPPLVLLVASLVVHAAGAPARAAALTAAVAFINYFSDTEGHPSGFGTVMPKSNLIQLSVDVAAGTTAIEAWARGFGRLSVPQRAMVARSSLPFAVFETIVEGDRLGRFKYDGTDITIYPRTGGVASVKTTYVLNASQASAAARKYREDGYTVWRRDW